jgi:hypothetical protein
MRLGADSSTRPAPARTAPDEPGPHVGVVVEDDPPHLQSVEVIAAKARVSLAESPAAATVTYSGADRAHVLQAVERRIQRDQVRADQRRLERIHVAVRSHDLRQHPRQNAVMGAAVEHDVALPSQLKSADQLELAAVDGRGAYPIRILVPVHRVLVGD